MIKYSKADQHYISSDELEAKYADKTPEELKKLSDFFKTMGEEIERVFHARGIATRPGPKYTYVSKPATDNGIEGVYITGTLVNEDEMQAHLDLYGFIDGSWDKTRHSVFYYRMNGLIFHSHGGWILLGSPDHTGPFSSDYPIACTDEQWNMLLSGTVPTELFNERIKA
jgi:hypothetical protein